MKLDDDDDDDPCSPMFFLLDLELGMVFALLGFSRAVLEEVTRVFCRKFVEL
jgi:hypothetical protein